MWMKRQNNGDGYPGDGFDGPGYDNTNGGFWWSPAGMAVRYGIVAFICLVFVIFFVGGYYHAQSRQRKGLPPLAYHRWMVRRTYTPHGRYAAPYYNQGQAYDMQQYPPPPPIYSQNEVPPPAYVPPEGASKTAPNQNVVEVRPQFVGESSGQNTVTSPLPAADRQYN